MRHYRANLLDGFQELLAALSEALAATPAESAANPPIEADDPCPFGPQYQRYWNIRRQLFRRWEQGVQCDVAGLYSVKPEEIADAIAADVSGPRVLDAFCGLGGSAIAFARAGKQVATYDVDASRLELAKANARVYGVADRIAFRQGASSTIGRTSPRRRTR